MDPVKIPFGYKRVYGQIQRGDGVLDPVTGLYHRVRKEYPRTDDDRIFIRRCVVEQTELPVVSENSVHGESCACERCGGVRAFP